MSVTQIYKKTRNHTIRVEYEVETTALGARIMQALEKNRMTHAQLAKKAGIARTTVTYYCSGRTEPSASNIVLICKALGVSPNWLITGKEVWPA